MPQHKRGPWSSQEDQLLLTLVNLHGAHNWVRISTTIGTRSPKQCRERFHQNLKPNLNHDPITPEEGLLIEQMVAEMGKRWAEIARRLRGRSDNAVKNWWNGSMNRRRRSHHQRRQEFSVRQPAQVGMVPPVQQPLPGSFPSHPMMAQQLPPQYYSQALYQQQTQHHRGPFPQPISLPSNAPPFGRPLLMETPLPSPSSFSQLSAEGAPSLVSDTSSSSARSPNNGSPIELPPLSSREDRRPSAPMLQLGAPATFANEPDYHMMPMHDAHKHMLVEQYPRTLAPAFAQRASYSNLAPRQPMMHMMGASQHYIAAPFVPPPPAQVLKSQQAPTPPALQLPSISDLAGQDAPAKSPGLMIDPHLVAHGSPATTASSFDESPKNKMKLSNITL